MQTLRILDAVEVPLADGRVAWSTKAWSGAPAATLIGTKVDLADVVRRLPEGLILEFGVAAGHSFKRLAEAVSPHIIYGFDWWQGLPHDWNPYDVKGCLKTDKPDPPDNGVLVDGLFSDTLEEFLSAHPDPVAFVHVDCDLYCATAYVLHCLMGRFVTGSIIAFDEIEQWDGERQAWNRYQWLSQQRWDLVGKQHAWGEVYVKAD